MISQDSSNSVLFILSSLRSGGSENKTISVANALADQGYKVHLAYLNAPDDLLPRIGSNVVLLRLGRTSRLDLKVVKQLRKYIKGKEITSVLCVNRYPMLYACLALSCLNNKVAMNVSINTTYFNDVYNRLQMLLYAPIMHRMKHIIFGSIVQKNHWVKTYYLSESKVHVIYNGVDAEKYNVYTLPDERDDIRHKYGIVKDEIVLGMIARFMPEKGHEYLLEAVSRLIKEGFKIKLMLVGDGIGRDHVEHQIRKKSLDGNVLMLGLLQDVRPALVAMDIFLLTSLSETFSNAALEAMAMEKPVILSNIGGASEMVQNTINGFLFKPGDVDDLVKTIKCLFDPNIRILMSRNARDRVCKDFSIKKMVVEYEKLIFS